MVQRVAVAMVLVGGALVIWLLASTRPVEPAATPTRIAATPEVPPPMSREKQLRAEPLPAALQPLLEVAQPKLPSAEGDWLSDHPEDGQSLTEHRAECVPVIGKTIYLVPTGPFDADATTVLTRLGPLLAAHFQLPVKLLPPLPASIAGKRERKRDFGKQWLTKDILDGLLDVRPADAAAVMAVTTVDLYPDPAWNFVFGEATHAQRVGVMSLFRTGDLRAEPALVLTRTYATGMHEIGHMLQLYHCVAWECPMNGSNHQEEADSRPLEPCPHCLAKLMLATGLEPKKRWAELRAAFADAGITRGVKEIDRELSVVK